MTRPDHEIEAYLEGTLTEAQARVLDAWITADPANATAFLYLVHTHEVLVDQGKDQLRRRQAEESARLDQTSAAKQGLMDAEVLDLLQEIEETGQDIDPMALAAARFGPKPNNNPTKHDYAEAGRYILEHALANKRLLYTAGSAIAAVLLIALTLVFVFSGGSGEPVADPLADIELWDTTPKHLPVVATLTDRVGAQWRSSDKPVSIPLGAQFVAFERYTLTHGFAEITTRRGAKALLQAPCTIELTESDNAIRLHSGKLVGKCETPLSKGFIVHAPDMDVVDLGTEFGVNADMTEGSTVLVMTGEVRAQPTERSPLAFTPVVLRKDQARQIVPETGGLGMIAVSEAPVFYEDKPHPYVTAVLDAAPVAYWRFEDDANKAIANEVDPGRSDLQAVGPTKLTSEGVVGNAGRLENQSAPYAYFETAGAIEQMNAKENYTVELWYYTDQAYVIKELRGVGSLVVLFDPLTIDHSLGVQLEQDAHFSGSSKPIGWRANAIRFYPAFINTGTERRDLYSDSDYPIRRWQHLVVVNKKGAMQVYLDGQLAEAVPHNLAPIMKTAVRLGVSAGEFEHANSETDPSVMRPLRGRFDEVAIYNKALSDEEIAKHYTLATGAGSSP